MADPERARAISRFYREEFERHLEHLRDCGLLDQNPAPALERACVRLVSDLDRLCCRDDFPAVAEKLLHNFDCLTGLSQLDPRQGH